MHARATRIFFVGGRPSGRWRAERASPQARRARLAASPPAVGSPLSENERELVKLGKKLKKNNVAVDIVSFGDESAANAPLLEAFIGAVNSSDNSHLLSVPPGPHYLSDMVLSSPIVLGDAADGASSSAGGASARYSGWQPEEVGTTTYSPGGR